MIRALLLCLLLAACGRPLTDNERAFLLIPVGYPAVDCEVPDISRKSLEDILVRRYPGPADEGDGGA